MWTFHCSPFGSFASSVVPPELATRRAARSPCRPASRTGAVLGNRPSSTGVPPLGELLVEFARRPVRRGARGRRSWVAGVADGRDAVRGSERHVRPRASASAATVKGATRSSPTAWAIASAAPTPAMPTPVATPASDSPPRGTPATAPTPVASRATDPTTPAALTAASAPPPTTAAASRGFRSRAFPTEASALPASRGDRARPVGELAPEPGRGRSGGAGCGDHGGGPVAGIAHVLPGLGEEPLRRRRGRRRRGRRRARVRRRRRSPRRTARGPSSTPPAPRASGPRPRRPDPAPTPARSALVVGGAGGLAEGGGGVLPASGLGGERRAEPVRRRPGPAFRRPDPPEPGRGVLERQRVPPVGRTGGAQDDGVAGDQGGRVLRGAELRHQPSPGSGPAPRTSPSRPRAAPASARRYPASAAASRSTTARPSSASASTPCCHRVANSSSAAPNRSCPGADPTPSRRPTSTWSTVARTPRAARPSASRSTAYPPPTIERLARPDASPGAVSGERLTSTFVQVAPSST